jgi:putative two-component system response regulator
MGSAATAPNRVLLVGSPETLGRTAGLLAVQPWSHEAVHSPAEALRYLRADPLVDVVLMMPADQIDAYTELCRGIKMDERSRLIAVTCLLSPGQDGHVIDFYSAGADDCIRSCATDREVLLRLLKTFRTKHATDTLEDAGVVIMALANAVEGKDHYTCGHVDRVSTYCVAIGRRIGVDAEGLAALKTGGAVHDIGKIGIPDHILNKPGRLTDEEMAVMRRHPVIGYDILKPLRTFQGVLPIVRWHHEKPSGTGYPDGLKGQDIPLLARITSVADVFDALTTDRPYRPGLPLPQSRAILNSSADNGDLDPLLVQIFQEILDSSAPAGSGQEGPLPAVGAAAN